MSARARVVVRGFVQGVGFRASTRARAVSLGLAGWVSNRGDGSVEAVFEGAVEAVESLVRLCGRGPRGAEVVEVEPTEEEPEGLRGFEIR